MKTKFGVFSIGIALAGSLLCSPALAAPVKAGDLVNLGTWSDLYAASLNFNAPPDSTNIAVLPDGPGLSLTNGLSFGALLLRNSGDYYVLSEPGVAFSATDKSTWSDFLYVDNSNFKRLVAVSDTDGAFNAADLAMLKTLLGNTVETPGVWQDVGVPFGIDANRVLFVSDGDPSNECSVSCQDTGAAAPLPTALPLFATGLGAMGLLGWRRKRKNAAALAAA
jgi:hypothetical protein